jgi:serine/threonine protein kinase
VLGSGTYGVTYLAWDPLLARKVAIKEFLPTQIAARRNDGLTVEPHSHHDDSAFEYGRTRFRQEARMLCRFDHPNIIKVLDTLEDNSTEYMVMEFYEGQTVLQYLDAYGRLLPGPAVNLMCDVLIALEEVHSPRSGQIHIHRDVKPANIYLANSSAGITPKLLDFGAARAAIGERTKDLTRVITEGYAPFEQCHSGGKQGPWTDVYACGATLYHLVAGTIPIASKDRIQGVPLPEPRSIAPDVPDALSAAILHGMEMNLSHRPQSALEFRQLLESTRPAPAPRAWTGGRPEPDASEERSTDHPAPPPKRRLFRSLFGNR